jgi:hypothetical protein
LHQSLPSSTIQANRGYHKNNYKEPAKPSS